MSTPTGRGSAPELFKRVGPEVHGGPEGIYAKEETTGRWRSMSRARGEPPRTDGTELAGMNALSSSLPQPQGQVIIPGQVVAVGGWPSAEMDRLQEQLMGEFEPDPSKPSPSGDPAHSPQSIADLASAREAIRESNMEVEKLWEAVRFTVQDKGVLAELMRRDAVSRAILEAEIAKQRLQGTWDMIRANTDMNTFAAVTRKAAGCEGGRSMSVGAARRLFERTAEEKTGTRNGGRDTTPSRGVPPRRGLSREPRLPNRDSHRPPAAEPGTRSKLPQRPALPCPGPRPNAMLLARQNVGGA